MILFLPNFIRVNLVKITLIVSLIFTLGFTSQLITDDTYFTSSITYLTAANNFHTVKENKLYRSAELSETELRKKINQYGIKSVIDLRMGGENIKKKKYSESSVVKEMGANYYWIPLAGMHTRQKNGIKRYIELIKEIEGPVLIHCVSGSHRSGLASAIWLMTNENEDPEIASKQLSSKYGFFYTERKFKGMISNTTTIDNIMWNYLDVYKDTGLDFITWVNDSNNRI
jgi:protein tyrosine phosphatase (PTP) superfamily phosphohydrolase (DUF442 family)